MGKYKVPHFDAKGEADQLFQDAGVATTFLLTSFYWENLIYFGLGPKPGPDGTLTIAYDLDDKKMPSIAVEDIGKCAYAIFKRGGEFIGLTKALGARGSLQRGDARGLPKLRLSWRRRCWEHVPVQARLQRLLPRSPGH